MIAAMAMAAGAAFADTAIQSANVVGYTTQDVGAGKFAMIGVQFEGVGSDAEVAVNDLISGDFAAVDNNDDEFLSTANQLQHWTGDGYDIYYYINDAWYDNGTEDGDWKLGWSDVYGEFTYDTLKPGDAAWFKATTGACTLTTAGQVYAGETSVTCPNGKFTMAANATPIPLCLNNAEQITFTDIISVENNDDEFLNTAVQVQVWDGNGYAIYYFISDAWYDNGTEDGDYKEGWADVYGELTAETIPVGRGFWVKANTGTFTINFQ